MEKVIAVFGNLSIKIYLKIIEIKGFKHGNNFNIEKGANVDSKFCMLISCGNNVTFAKDVYILAHDASMKKFIGKTKSSPVSIGNNVFIGAKSIVMPGVTIGDDCIIGANSCVTKNIPPGEVWGGVPAKYIMKTKDFIKKHKEKMMLTNTSIEYID